MSVLRLTEAQVRRLLAEPVTRDTSYFDTELTRFALRLWPSKSGTRSSSPATASGRRRSWFS
jgi:hypothetical protein